MSFWKQLRYLLWKNLLLRKRQKLWAAIEICWPLVLFLILVWVRTRDLTEKYHECHYHAKAMPSAGFLPFMQSYLCTLKNTCQLYPNTDADVGVVNSDVSFLNILTRELQLFVGSQQSVEDVDVLLNALERLVNITNGMPNAKSTQGDIRMSRLFKDKETFITAAVFGDVKRQVAENWYNSYLKPEFFVVFFKILKEKGIDLTNPTAGDEKLFDVASDVQKQIYCNFTTLNATTIAYNETVLREIGKAVCDMRFERFLIDNLNNFDRTAVMDAGYDVLANMTGIAISPTDIQSLTVVFNILRQDMGNSSALGRIMKSLSGAFRSDVGSSSNSFLAAVCGKSANSTTVEQLRDRFEGESASKLDAKQANETFSAPDSPINVEIDEKISDENTTSNFTKNICTYIPIDPVLETKCWNLTSRAFQVPPSFVAQLFTMLRGFVLVAPYSKPTTVKLITKMNSWLDGMRKINGFLRDFDLNAANYQDALNQSELATTYHTLMQIVVNLNNVTGFLSNETVDELESLGALFLSSNDSNAALPKLREKFSLIIDLFECFRTNRFIFVPNEESLEKLGVCLSDFYLYLSGLVFEVDPTSTTLPPLVTYKIRMANYLTDGTTRVQDKIWNPRPRDRPFVDMKYIYYGFSFLQDAVDRAIIEMQTNQSTKTGIYAQQFPNPCYLIDIFVKAVARMLPLCMSLAWVFSASLIVKNVVYEKEMRLKEFMKVMGLGNFVHWMAWFIQTFLMMFASIILFVLIIKYGNIVRQSDATILLVFLILYAVATITQCFLVSTFFSKANLAAACGAFIYFLLYLPYPMMINFVDFMSYSQKTASCLLAQVSFGWGCSYIAAWEEQGDGLHWSNMHVSPDEFDDFSFATTMWMLVADSFIYILLTWYIEAVFPGQYGIALKWYFLLQRSYWCGERCQKVSATAIELDANVGSVHLKGFVEVEPTNLTLGVSVCNLRKVYSNGKVAVDGLSLNFYENQITSFLGHNGAGKTTTISILTGLYAPTSGTVLVNGKDIRTQINVIRQSLGMCPQHNILFDILTVEEQLKFYAGLKGVPQSKIDDEVRKMIKLLCLKDKKHSLASDLSGGMQRKLSIAVAFIGESKTVVLDEPTAGVDPFARRGIWDLLLQMRKGRTIILSTHHMDEADLLGDRIAIISSGRLKCCGSSLFLKKKFGSGYYLTVVCESKSRAPSSTNLVALGKGPTKLTPINTVPKSTEEKNGDTSGASLKVPAALPPIPKPRSAVNLDIDIFVDPICNFVTSEVPEAKMIEQVGQEINFNLPSDDPQMLCKFFIKLDKELKNLNISSYGVSETKLEEIFLKADSQAVDERNNDDDRPTNKVGKWRQYLISKFRKHKKPPSEVADLMESSAKKVKDDENDGGQDIEFVPSAEKREERSGWWRIRRQIKALMVKRMINFYRNKKGVFSEVILPIIVIAVTLYGLSLQPSKVVNQPPLLLTPWLYRAPNFIFYDMEEPGEVVIKNETIPIDNNSSVAIGRSVLESLLEPPDIGCRCMPGNPLKTDNLYCVPDEGRRHFGAASYKDVQIYEDLCACDNRSIYTCPTSAYSPDPPNVLTNTTDYLMNLTMLNVSQWILMTEHRYRKHRYGGFSLGEVNDVAGANIDWPSFDANVLALSESFNAFFHAVNLNFSAFRDFPTTPIVDLTSNYSKASEFNSSLTLQQVLSGLEVRNNVKVWYNNQGWAALPAYMNTLSNALLRALLPKDKDPKQFGIITYNHPMNYTNSQQGQRMAFGYNIGIELTEAMMILLAFSIVPASFVLFLMEEKTNQSKHLQFVSGVNPYVYWITNFVWDLINFLIPVTGVVIIFFIFNETAYIGWFSNFLASVLLLVLYGFATIPIMYNFTFVFRIPSLAFISLAVGNLFLGWVSTTVTATLEMLGQDDEELLSINSACMTAFLLLPQYCLGRGLLDMKLAYYLYLGETFAYGRDNPPNLFRWKVLGRNFVCMFVEGILAFALVLLIEKYHLNQRSKPASLTEPPPADEDDDVKLERQHVRTDQADMAAVKITNLTKDYKTGLCSCTQQKSIRAVDNICVAIERGECFGLLGVNGAGKTTTFKMLTGKSSITSGDACFGGFSVLKNLSEVRQQIGFCPQFDALNLLLTGREQLIFYARLRGIPEKDISKTTSALIARLNLSNWADRVSQTYSGGNKRKLSTAIALIGNPPVILLDEPTTGMDPKARRFLWNRINEIVRDGRSVILTSHSMEECEALCNRMGIMVNGRFRCLGSVQHLKSRFGEGYTLTLKLGGETPKTDEVALLVKARFSNAILKERHFAQLQYQLPAKGVALSQVFSFVVELHKEAEIDDYSISQTTLDEVFIAFAKQQREIVYADEKVDSVCCGCLSRKKKRAAEDPLNDRTVTVSVTPPATASSTASKTGATGDQRPHGEIESNSHVSEKDGSPKKWAVVNPIA